MCCCSGLHQQVVLLLSRLCQLLLDMCLIIMKQRWVVACSHQLPWFSVHPPCAADGMLCAPLPTDLYCCCALCAGFSLALLHSTVWLHHEYLCHAPLWWHKALTQTLLLSRGSLTTVVSTAAGAMLCSGSSMYSLLLLCCAAASGRSAC